MSTSGNNKAEKIKEFFECFLSLNAEEAEESMTFMRTEAFRRAFQKFRAKPDELERRVHEVESAFTQLSQVKRILSEPVAAPETGPMQILDRARKQFKEKKFLEAVSSCEEAISLGMMTEEAYLLCGSSALYAKDHNRADYWASLVLKLNAGNPHALVLKAMTIKGRDATQALAYLEQALRLRPDSSVIKSYRDQVLLLLKKPQAVHRTDPFGFKRKWLRAKLSRAIQINDFATSVIYPFKTVSLSAGGCLIAGTDLPEQFQFTLDLQNAGKIWGRGQRAYDVDKRYTGIRFLDLNRADESRIDHEVKSAKG